VADNYDKYFMHISPHAGLVIGKRGLVEEEKERGIVLVFGSQSYKSFHMDNQFISVQMKFSGRWEEVFIPFEAVTAIFNDPVSPEFMFNFKTPEEPEQPELKDLSEENNVIRHDFSKKKK
jgi:stringent starvation protein B